MGGGGEEPQLICKPVNPPPENRELPVYSFINKEHVVVVGCCCCYYYYYYAVAFYC
jgi:hypothetical protein